MELPSKELLSATLGVDIETIKGVELDEEILIIWEGKQNTFPHKFYNGKEVNIYKLAHKCKEWAFRKGYQLASYKSEHNWICKDPFQPYPYEGADTEPEAIFQACEYILTQTKDKK